MSTKQIRLLCLVNATDGTSAQLTVSINGVQKFSGPVNQTALAPNAMYTVPIDLTQFSVVTFDQVADDLVAPRSSPPDINSRNEFLQYWSTGPYEFSATVTGGDVSISLIQANYNGMWDGTPLSWYTGSAEYWTGLYCASQPLWNGSAIPSRFIWPVDPAQGPNAILIDDTETVTYQIGVTKYNSPAL